MYIKLGTTDIKYLTSQDDFMIISEVVDSGMSYERPTLVRTSDELDIWFGRSFSDRDYLAELLETGVTLFLYKPIDIQVNNKGENYIDYYSFDVDPTLYYNESELPKEGKDNTKYKLVSLDGSLTDEEADVKYNYYIWLDSEYVDVRNLPQNLDTSNTLSQNNRDILCINYNGYLGPSYVYPDYQQNSYNSTATHSDDIDAELLLSNLPDLEKVDLGYETLCYNLKFTEDINFGITKTESPYVIIPVLDNQNIMIYFDAGKGIPTSVASRYYSASKEINIVNKDRETIINEFISILNDYGYLTDKISEVDYQTYTSFSTVSRYFYNLEDYSMTPNFNRTHDILSEVSKNDRRIEFIARTIGTDDEKIKINIVRLGTDNYRITISRFDYYEVFEGGIFDLTNKVDNKINNESKLVRCNIASSYLDDNGKTVSYKLEFDKEKGERDSSLPEGTWELRRGEVEEYSAIMYWSAINSIFNNGDTVYFDYLLVPNIKNYLLHLESDSDYSYYQEYAGLLSYAELIDCQVLIQNSDSEWKIEEVDKLPSNPKEKIVYQIEQEDGGFKFYILNENGNLEETTDRDIINTYGNDYVFNYAGDMENRLVYFYRPMTVLGNKRPAYYLFLSGLFSDTYSMSVKYILYNSPVKNPYEDEEIESRLEKYKSNYLVDNNQIYYYKKYQNGYRFNTSIWMRFVIGKVKRELEKNKWRFLSERMSGNIRNTITDIFNKITNSFSIVRRISLTKFNLKYNENKLELGVEIYTSDLVNNNISLDITLNYNK